MAPFDNLQSVFDHMMSPPSHVPLHLPAAHILEDIASTKEDVLGWEQRIAEIDREIPRMERERLEKQRDVAVAKLRIVQLRARLAQKGGNQ